MRMVLLREDNFIISKITLNCRLHHMSYTIYKIHKIFFHQSFIPVFIAPSFKSAELRLNNKMSDSQRAIVDYRDNRYMMTP